MPAGVLEYRLDGEWTVLAGRTDADNDHLSTRLCEAEDWWFHVDGTSGSHVILKNRPPEERGGKTLREAAAIAAYHSKARRAKSVGVYYTRGKHVNKRRGSDVGTVEVARGKILKVQPRIDHAIRLDTNQQSNAGKRDRR